MCSRACRIVAVAAASLIWLAGCDTTSGVNPLNPFNLSVTPADPNARSSDAPPPMRWPPPIRRLPPRPRRQKPQWPFVDPPATPQLLGADPNDDLSLAKKYFRQGSYGLAERQFRKAVELHPKRRRSLARARRVVRPAAPLRSGRPRLCAGDPARRPDAGDPEQPGLLLHAARRLRPRPHHAAGRAGQGSGQSLHPEQSGDAGRRPCARRRW